MGLVDEKWEEFYRRILQPIGPSPIQIRETRRAFYAGVDAVFTEVLNRMSMDGEPTKEDIALLDGITKDLKRFQKALRKGEA